MPSERDEEVSNYYARFNDNPTRLHRLNRDIAMHLNSSPFPSSRDDFRGIPLVRSTSCREWSYKTPSQPRDGRRAVG